MLSLRLFLPESWTSNEARMIKAGVPEQFWQPRTKPELAIEEIDRVAAAGVRFGCVLADAGYGLSAPFRQALSTRGLCWAVGIPKHQKVYPVDVQLVFPVAARGRPRLRHVPDRTSIAAHAMLEDTKWSQVSWRRGTRGRLVARFAAVRVRIADGAPQRIGSSGAQHMPGEEVWLVGEHRSNGERKYYLSNLPADTPIKELAGAIKARWICEQAHQQLKEELGLDHFEGRSWTGLHRHALMTMMAYAFLQIRRLAQAGRKKESPDRRLSPACRQSGKPSLTACSDHRRPTVPAAAALCHRQKSQICQSSARVYSYKRYYVFKLVRSVLVLPVSRRMDDTHDHDAFPSGHASQFIGDDVGQAGDGLLIGSAHSPWPARRHVSKGFSCVPNSVRNLRCGGRTVFGYVFNLNFDVVQRFTGPCNWPLHALPAPFSALVASMTA